MYRVGHPSNNKLGIYDWLKEVLDFDDKKKPGAVQRLFNAEYMRTNRKKLVADYSSAYTRK